MVRDCKAVAEEDSGSGLHKVPERVRKLNQADRKKPRRGVNREPWQWGGS